MAVTGTIMALDLATRTGFAIGKPGGAIRSGSVRLRDSEDINSRGFRKLGIWLRDQFSVEMPELVMIEAPLPVGAMIDWDGGDGHRPKFRSNPNTIFFLNGLVSGAHTICGPYGVRCLEASVQTVRKHFVGHARPENPKAAVIARCRQLGLMASQNKDDNEADALALHDYAVSTYGNRAASFALQVAR